MSESVKKEEEIEQSFHYPSVNKLQTAKIDANHALVTRSSNFARRVWFIRSFVSFKDTTISLIFAKIGVSL